MARSEPQRLNHRPSGGRRLPLFRELHAENAQEDEEPDPEDPEADHEAGPFRLLKLLPRDFPPEDEESCRRGEPDDDHRREIDGPLEGPAHEERGHRHHRRDRERGKREPECAHGARVRFGRWTAPRTTSPATTTSSSSSATASASTPRTSSSG